MSDTDDEITVNLPEDPSTQEDLNQPYTPSGADEDTNVSEEEDANYVKCLPETPSVSLYHHHSPHAVNPLVDWLTIDLLFELLPRHSSQRT